MKNKLKQYLRSGILCFGILFLFWNCRQQDDLTPGEIVKEKKINIISFHDFKDAVAHHESFTSISQYFDKVQASDKSSGFSKTSENTLILTDKIIKAAKEESISYTFRLLKTQEENEFYNWVVDVDHNGNIQKSVIFKYMPSDSWLADTSQPFSGYVSVQSNDIFSVDDMAGAQNLAKTDPCYEVSYEWECNAGNDHAPNTCTAGGSDLVITYFEVTCSYEGGGGGDGVSFPVGEQSPSGPGGGGGSGGGSNPGADSGITSPIGPDDSGPDVQILNDLLTTDLSPLEAGWISESVGNSALTAEIFNWMVQDGSPEAEGVTHMTLTALALDKLAGPYDAAYYTAIDPYTDADLTVHHPVWGAYFAMQCAMLKMEHPEWSNARIYWEAAKEMLHLALDIGGLVPVLGEICDVVNGVIYTIEGDGVNATLSFAATIPIAGWFVTGAKVAYKGSLKLVVKAGDVIDFGSKNSTRFRKALGMVKGDSRQAHHIIPRGKSAELIVQQAAKDPRVFHIDEALNGIPVEAWRNQPNHPDYTNRILQKLQDFNNLSPNATPQECYDFLTDLIDDIKTAITSNLGTHLNDIIF